MDTARAWLRKQARGTLQTGILVTKVAARFKPLAVNILAQGDDNAVHWFLEDKTDIRSSNYLEDPTRLPEFYDGTYKYLKSLGIKEI